LTSHNERRRPERVAAFAVIWISAPCGLGSIGAISVANRVGTLSSSIRREVGSSTRAGQPRHVKIVHAGGVAAGDLGLFVVRHPARISARVFRDW